MVKASNKFMNNAAAVLDCTSWLPFLRFQTCSMRKRLLTKIKAYLDLTRTKHPFLRLLDAALLHYNSARQYYNEFGCQCVLNV